jgi:hypothetical protein
MHRWLGFFLIGAAIFLRPVRAVSMTASAAERSIPTPPILAQDPRLDKPVTLRLRKCPLSTVTAALGGQIGVTLTASPEVADEPAIVYATAQPAKQVMQHLALLFNYRWRRHGKSGEPGYELYQDVKSRQEEEALRQREVAQALEALRQAIRERLELAQRSPDDLNKAADAAKAEEQAIDASLKTASAASAAAGRRSAALDAAATRLRTMADPVQRALINAAASLRPEQWEALAAGKPLFLSTRPEEGMLPLPSAVSRELREARPKWGDPSIRYIHDSPQDEAQFNQMEAELQNGWARADAIRVNIWLQISPRPLGMLDWHGRPGEAPSRQAILSVVPVPQIPAGPHTGFVLSYTGLKVHGNEAPFSPDDGAKPGDRKPGTDANASAEASAARDPILGIRRSFPLEVKFADPDFGWARFQFLNEVLPRIAETYGINLVADAYRQRFPMVLPPSTKEERSLAAVLDQYVLPRAQWSREGEFIHVRRWTWYDDRLAEIPERLVKYWAEYLRKQPSLSLDDAAALTLALRDEQLGSFEETMRDEGVLLKDAHLVPESGFFYQSVLTNAELLRAYAGLTPAQHQGLEAGKPVPSAAMAPDARAWLRAAMTRRLRLPADSYKGGLPPFLPAVLSGEPPPALTLSRFRLQDGSAPGGSFEQINLNLEYGAEDRSVQFIYIAPRIALERPPREVPAGTGRVVYARKGGVVSR